MSIDDFDFKKFIKSLSDEQLSTFATTAGTTPLYLKRHLMYRCKYPSPGLIDALVIAGQGKFSKGQFVNWLYQINAS